MFSVEVKEPDLLVFPDPGFNQKLFNFWIFYHSGNLGEDTSEAVQLIISLLEANLIKS